MSFTGAGNFAGDSVSPPGLDLHSSASSSRLSALERRLSLLARLSEILATPPATIEVLQLAVDAFVDPGVGFRYALIYRLSPERDSADLVAAGGIPAGCHEAPSQIVFRATMLLGERRLNADASPTWLPDRAPERVTADDTTWRHLRTTPSDESVRTGSVLLAPLKEAAATASFGFLVLARERPGAVGTSDLEFAQVVARLFSPAVADAARSAADNDRDSLTDPQSAVLPPAPHVAPERANEERGNLSAGPSRGAGRDRLVDRITDSIPLMVWVSDARGARCRINQSGAEYLGLDRQRLSMAELLHRLTNGDHDAAASLTAALASESPFEIELRIRRADGVGRRHLLRGVPVRREHGALECWTGTVTDVEELKASESALRQSLEQYERLIGLLPVGVYACDASGRVTMRNRQAVELCGGLEIGSTDAPGRGLMRMQGPDGTGVSLEEAPSDAVLRTGEGVRDRQMTLERPDGTSVHVSVNVDPLRDADGAVSGAIAVLFDVTQRKLAEDRLRQSDERFRVVLKNSPILVCTCDRELRYTWVWNFPWNYPQQQVLGRRDEDILPWEQVAELVALKSQVLRSGIGVRRELRLVTPASARWFDIAIEPLQGPCGEITGLTMVAMDVTERKAAAEAQHEREARFRVIFAQAMTGIALLDRKGRFTLVNDKECQITGRTREELLQMTFLDIAHPRDAAANHIAFQQLLAGGDDVTVENRILRPDGATRWVHKNISGIRGEDGQVTSAVVVMVDITDRRQAEEALRDSEERFRAALRAQTGIAYDWRLDSDTVWRSGGTLEMLGIPPEEVEPTGAWWRERLHPDDAARVDACFAAAVESGAPTFSAEYRVRHRDGRWLWLWDHMQLRYAGRGRVARVVGCSVNIDARKRAEVGLRESEARFRAFAEQSDDVFWMAAPDGSRLTYASPAFESVFGLKPELALGSLKALRAVVHADDRARQHELWDQSLREPSSAEYRIVRPRGEVSWIRDRRFPVFDDDGRLLYVAGVAEDITRQRNAAAERDQLLDSERAARAEAERHSRVKDDFLAALSHELRTPLTAIQGWAQLLIRGRVSLDELTEIGTIIERNARTQAQMIGDLLDMSRLNVGKLRLDLEQVNMVDVIEQAIEVVRQSATERGQQIHCELGDDPVFVTGDGRRLQQVVWNLVGNAIRFTPEGGEIHVTLRRNQNAAEITVRDNGQGIREEFLPFVFERFRQADSTITRVHGGLGLGLALVRQLTELHGGQVGASSEGDGRGATFTVKLPLVPCEAGKIRLDAGIPLTHNPRGLTDLRILVVEDDADTRKFLYRILEECGAEVTPTESVPEALERLESQRFDLIVSDIGLPGEDGFSLIRRLRESHPAPNSGIPAVALTALARPDDERRSLLSGFQAHLGKPIEPNRLVAALVALSAGHAIKHE